MFYLITVCCLHSPVWENGGVCVKLKQEPTGTTTDGYKPERKKQVHFLDETLLGVSLSLLTGDIYKLGELVEFAHFFQVILI